MKPSAWIGLAALILIQMLDLSGAFLNLPNGFNMFGSRKAPSDRVSGRALRSAVMMVSTGRSDWRNEKKPAKRFDEGGGRDFR